MHDSSSASQRLSGKRSYLVPDNELVHPLDDRLEGVAVVFLYFFDRGAIKDDAVADGARDAGSVHRRVARRVVPHLDEELGPFGCRSA